VYHRGPLAKPAYQAHLLLRIGFRMTPDSPTPRPRVTRPYRDRRSAGHRPPAPPETLTHQAIGAVRFAQSLLNLSRPGIERQVAGLKTRRSSPDDDADEH
jgi:hypothetical protein